MASSRLMNLIKSDKYMYLHVSHNEDQYFEYVLHNELQHLGYKERKSIFVNSSSEILQFLLNVTTQHEWYYH